MTFGSLSSLCLSVCICIRIHMCIVYTVQSYHNILILAYNMSEVSSYISVRARVVPSNQIMRQSKRNASCGILQRLLKVVHLTAADVLFHMSYTTTPCHLSPFPHFPGLLCPQPHRHPPCQATKVPAAMEVERRRPLDLSRDRPSNTSTWRVEILI